jgi:nitroreductase
MDVKEAVQKRKSIRAYQSKPVPLAVLKDIMHRALRAPSWGNTQPWGFTIVGGQTMQKIRDDYLRLGAEGAPFNPELDMPSEFNETQSARYKELGKGLLGALGIGREDKARREAYYDNMSRSFGAPSVIYIHLEKGFNNYALMDCGIIMQTIALLAFEYGLGTCFLARSVRYPGVVRKHAMIPGYRTIVMGLAIGYAVEDDPANLFTSKRGDPDEFIQWVDVAE